MESVLVRTRSKLFVKIVLPCIEYKRTEDGTVLYRCCDEHGSRFGDYPYDWCVVPAGVVHELLDPDEYGYMKEMRPKLSRESDLRHPTAVMEWLKDGPVKLGDFLVTVERIER